MSEAVTDEPAEDDREQPDPDAQSPGLRRQQYVVGIGGSGIAGLAVLAVILQTFPGVPTPVAAVLGGLATGFVYWLVRNSVFPGESETDA